MRKQSSYGARCAAMHSKLNVVGYPCEQRGNIVGTFTDGECAAAIESHPADHEDQHAGCGEIAQLFIEPIGGFPMFSEHAEWESGNTPDKMDCTPARKVMNVEPAAVPRMQPAIRVPHPVGMDWEHNP